ncbi:hypothetical protein CEXT_316571 [Caerostris extrusa]|uniref:Uncharacterized protein n=1 Tax=Caerostris extrusa TaxID=172846 RepID=A0AAV4T587_CAEEX|nr:hypothetical protein CEXT_316571 [Caerostris extrusa]
MRQKPCFLLELLNDIHVCLIITFRATGGISSLKSSAAFLIGTPKILLVFLALCHSELEKLPCVLPYPEGYSGTLESDLTFHGLIFKAGMCPKFLDFYPAEHEWLPFKRLIYIFKCQCSCKFNLLEIQIWE